MTFCMSFSRGLSKTWVMLGRVSMSRSKAAEASPPILWGLVDAGASALDHPATPSQERVLGVLRRHLQSYASLPRLAMPPLLHVDEAVLPPPGFSRLSLRNRKYSIGPTMLLTPLRSLYDDPAQPANHVLILRAGPLHNELNENPTGDDINRCQ